MDSILKKILVINAHPSATSFNQALTQRYVEQAIALGGSVDIIEIGQLNFDPNLRYGYQKRMTIEPDLLAAWEKIQSADHLVWIFPVWWGGLPAFAKGFIDRLFLPSQAFSYRENSSRVIGHLQSKSARIITTLDQPGWFYRWYYGEPSTRQLKKATLQFCGIQKVKVNYVGTVRGSTEKQRENWLQQVAKWAAQDNRKIKS